MTMTTTTTKNNNNNNNNWLPIQRLWFCYHGTGYGDGGGTATVRAQLLHFNAKRPPTLGPNQSTPAASCGRLLVSKPTIAINYYYYSD